MNGTSSRRGQDRLSPLPLLIVAAAVTIAAATNLLARWPGTLHFVALPPLDQMADLRALLIYAPNLPVFVVGVGLSLAGRAAIMAWMLGGLNRQRFWYALRFYLVVFPFSALTAVMFYNTGAVLFYGLFWFALVAALVTIGFTSAAPWLAPYRLRSGFAAAARSGFRAGTIGAYLLVLTLLGYLADVTAPVGPVLLVVASAGVTFAAAQMLYADPGFRVARRAAAVLPAAGIVALVVIAQQGPGAAQGAPEPEVPLPGSIMLMSGIDSRSGSGAILEIAPQAMGWTCEQAFYFSYAGPGDGQPQEDAMCTITEGAPYEREDTLRSTADLVEALEAQTSRMTPPGVVAGHSQGVWLVWQAAAENRLPNVETIVLVGAFPQNPIPYPAWGESGAGRVGRMAVSLLEGVARPGGTSVFRADSPLGREWLGHPSAIEQTLAQPLPDQISALSVASVFDLPLMRDGYAIDGAVDACPVPVIHPNLPYSDEFQQTVNRFVQGEPLDGCPFWRTSVGSLLRHFAAVAPAR